MKLWPCLATLTLFVFSASATNNSVWKFEGEPLDVAELRDQPGVLISTFCLKKICTAKQALGGQLADVAPRFERSGDGFNPVADKCLGEVIIAAARPGETRDFCRFSDGSIVSMNGLWVTQ